jgi:hypothetical protein
MDVSFFMFGQRAHFPPSAMRPPAGTPIRQPAPVTPPSPSINLIDIYASRKKEASK